MKRIEIPFIGRYDAPFRVNYTSRCVVIEETPTRRREYVIPFEVMRGGFSIYEDDMPTPKPVNPLPPFDGEKRLLHRVDL